MLVPEEPDFLTRLPLGAVAVEGGVAGKEDLGSCPVGGRRIG